MDILVKVIQFFCCFTLLVGIHEFGHFITARIFKMRVDKFYIFFDPWFSLFKFKRGDTEYGLGWLPLGGYCKIAGMIDESMDTEQMAEPAKPDEFRSKPAWQRLIVMLAGVIMNVLLAIVIYIGISYTWGESFLPNESVKWGYNFNDAGHEMGFQDGDKILSIDGEMIEDVNQIGTRLILSDGDRRVVVERAGREAVVTIPFEQLIEMRKEKSYKDLYVPKMPFIIDSVASQGANLLKRGDVAVALNGEAMSDYTAFREGFGAAKGESVEMTVLRDGAELNISVAVNNDGVIGVYTRNPYSYETRHYTLLEAIPAGLNRAVDAIGSYWGQLSLIFQPKTEMYRELGGFMAIGNMFPSVWDWEDFWLKTAFLSVMLAVMNILPIPGLDGAHATFTIYEMVTRRKPSDKFLEVMGYIGLIFIITLMLYANGNDFYRLIFG
ncbi:MAG: RIP metalloprotease RseP [Rikenellaceae bacterium]